MGRKRWFVFGVGSALVAAAIVWFALAISGVGDGPDDWRGLTMAAMAGVGFVVAYLGLSGRVR